MALYKSFDLLGVIIGNSGNSGNCTQTLSIDLYKFVKSIHNKYFLLLLLSDCVHCNTLFPPLSSFITVSPKQIVRLYSRFSNLDKSDSGVLR